MSKGYRTDLGSFVSRFLCKRMWFGPLNEGLWSDPTSLRCRGQSTSGHRKAFHMSTTVEGHFSFLAYVLLVDYRHGVGVEIRLGL